MVFVANAIVSFLNHFKVFDCTCLISPYKKLYCFTVQLLYFRPTLKFFDLLFDKCIVY